MVDAKDSLGATPLFYAVHKGSSPFAVQNFFFTQTTLSCNLDHFETSELLLKKGANASVTISNRKKQNLSILHLLAARERKSLTIEIVLKKFSKNVYSIENF